MATEITTELARLHDVLPDQDYQNTIRQNYTIGDHRVCWYCQVSKPLESDYPGDAIICNSCIPELWRKLQITQLSLASSKSYHQVLNDLRQTSQPEFIADVDEGIRKLREKGVTLSGIAADMLVELRGIGKTPEELQGHLTDYKATERLLSMMLKAIAKRDDQLNSTNPFADVDADDLLGNAMQIVIEEMVTNQEFARRVCEAIHDQVPGALGMMAQPAEVEVH